MKWSPWHEIQTIDPDFDEMPDIRLERDGTIAGFNLSEFDTSPHKETALLNRRIDHYQRMFANRVGYDGLSKPRPQRKKSVKAEYARAPILNVPSIYYQESYRQSAYERPVRSTVDDVFSELASTPCCVGKFISDTSIEVTNWKTGVWVVLTLPTTRREIMQSQKILRDGRCSSE